MGGAICGGSRKAANAAIKRAHCKRHKRQTKGCVGCDAAYMDAVDANFMSLM